MNRTLPAVAVIALLLLLASSSLASVEAQAPIRLRIWIKAFIPKMNPIAPNAVRQVPGTNDKWMIDGPPGLPCFMTDNRDFSPSRAASARVTTDFVLVVAGGTATVEVTPPTVHVHTAGMSTEVNCATGATVAQKLGVFSILHSVGSKPPEDAIGNPATAGTLTQIIFGVATVNPFAPPGISPAIDYSLDLTYDSATKKATFRANVGAFPAYEGYAQLGTAAPTTLFRASPTTATPWGLYDFGTGLATRVLSGTVQLP